MLAQRFEKSVHRLIRCRRHCVLDLDRCTGEHWHLLQHFAQVLGDGHLTYAVAERALDRLDVDHAGLDEMDRRYLTVIIDFYKGGPVGIETIAAALSEPRDTLEDVYEPFLIQQGFLARTARGRMATERAYQHLKVAQPMRQQGLF